MLLVVLAQALLSRLLRWPSTSLKALTSSATLSSIRAQSGFIANSALRPSMKVTWISFRGMSNSTSRIRAARPTALSKTWIFDAFSSRKTEVKRLDCADQAAGQGKSGNGRVQGKLMSYVMLRWEQGRTRLMIIALFATNEDYRMQYTNLNGGVCVCERCCSSPLASSTSSTEDKTCSPLGFLFCTRGYVKPKF